MKKHLRLILMAIIAMIVPLAAHAQQDVTQTWLLNPGFEEGPSFFHSTTPLVINGWNISADNLADAFLNQNDGATPPQGANVFGLWSPGSVGDFEISQTVKGLPAGTYTISCVLTTTKLEYTTQRFFVTSTSVGTKALYYESASLDTVAGEKYYFAGYPDDGNGNGPFRLMELKIKVAEGDSLAFGIRTNGTRSIIAPQLSTLAKNGHFKVDNFRLNFIADDVAYTKLQIQPKIDLIKALSPDTLPGGYSTIIAAKIIWADGEIATQLNTDSLNDCLDNLTSFIAEMAIAKQSFISLIAKIQEYEQLVAAWPNFPGRNLLDATGENAINTKWDPAALRADFDKAYADLTLAIRVYSEGRIPENLVLKAAITTSYISGWENMAGIKDLYEPKNSNDKNGMAYGNWDGSNGKTNWVQFEWPNYMNFTNFDVYWWCDNLNSPATAGISQPVMAKLEYNVNGAWVFASDVAKTLSQWNLTPFVYKTNKIRLSMTGTVATGILEVKITGFGKANPDVSDLKVLINDELVTVNAMNQDSLPRGYVPITTPLKAQSAELLLTTDSLGLVNNYSTLKTHRILLETAMASFKVLNKTLFTTTALAINASTTTAVIKTKLQELYNTDLAILLSNASLKDTIDKTNTSLTAYLSLNTTLVNTKAAIDAATTSALVKSSLLALYDNGVAVFTAPTNLTATLNTTRSLINGYVAFNTTLVAAKVALDKYTDLDPVMKPGFQTLYDNNVALFNAPPTVVAPITTANTLLNGYLTFNTTLVAAKVALDKYTDLDVVMKPGFKALYDNNVALFVAPPTVVAPITAANTTLGLYMTFNTTLVNAKVAIDASVSDVIKPRLQTVYDNAAAVFVAPTNPNAAITAANTLLNNYLSGNTRLVSTKVSLDKTSSLLPRKDAYQYAYDRAVTVFVNPTIKIDSVTFYTTSLYATQRLADTLATAEKLFTQSYYVSWPALQAAYDASLATFVTKTNVAGTLNTARSSLSAALLLYYQNNPVALVPVKRNDDFVNVYPTSVKRGSMITVDFSKDLVKPASVEMFMVSGQKVLKTSVNDKTSSVRVPASLASGIYLMVFDSPEGKTFKKIVVE